MTIFVEDLGPQVGPLVDVILQGGPPDPDINGVKWGPDKLPCKRAKGVTV